LLSQMPTSIVGSPEDADVERALTFVLENSQRFDPGARLDSLEVLRTQAADPEVRRALCAAARADRNPGVRMKALETLQGYEKDPAVRKTLLEALQSDDNSGVRVSAVNLLVNSLRADGESGPADPRILAVLRDRARNDPNNYIRLQSAAALRELGSSDLP
jgi:HEAT repeat protein